MMAVSMLSYALFIVLIAVGGLVSFFAYDIYRKTKGGSKAWLYMLITAVMIGIYSFAAALNGMMGINAFDNQYKLLLDSVAFMGLCLFFPLAVLRLSKDMGGKQFRFLSEKAYIAYFSVVLLSLSVLNIIIFPTVGLVENTVSIGINALMFTFPILAAGAYMLAKQTRMFSWKLMIVGAILITTASVCEASVSNACGGWAFNDVRTGKIAIEDLGVSPICEQNTGTMFFATVLPAGQTLDFLLGFAIYSNGIFMVGALAVVLSFFLMWRGFREPAKQ